MSFNVEFGPEWEKYSSKLDHSIRKRIIKKLKQLFQERKTRKLKVGLPYNVIEVGQYRICFVEDKKEKKRILYFVGTHKEYERWIGLRK